MQPLGSLRSPTSSSVQFALDGSAVDIWTVAVAITAIFIRPIRRRFSRITPCFNLTNCVSDFLNGATLVPFALLVGAVMSNAILAEALKTNKIFMALAGAIGMLYIVGELLSSKLTH